MFRITGLAALVVAIWLFSVYGPTRPAAVGLDAPATEFSAARASAALGRVLGAEKPHPVGSAEDAAVRARLIGELKALGLAPVTQTRASCWADPRWGDLPCGTVTNVIAAVTPGRGKQVLLMAHYDSVAAGPGGCDDGCGVATLLETIRALRARRTSFTHPITAVFTDGEEPGLLGAAAYFGEAANRDKVGMVVNIDDRGNHGTNYLFQTSPGDSRLVDLYARATPHVATSSLYAEIFKHLPNDTDMTTALKAGMTGYNFAMIGDVAQYHTPLDRRENIEPAGLQQHGEAMLALAQALGNADYATLTGGDAIYLDVLGLWLPRLPMAWALPLSIASFVLIALAGFLTRRGRREHRRPVLSFLMPPLLLAGCIGLGYVLHGLAAWISGHVDPSFAHPVWLRLSLSFGAFAVALLTSRLAGGICAWLWFAGMAIVASISAPGATPYFLFPALVAAPLLLATIRGGRDVALAVAALVGLAIWISLLPGAEDIMGLQLHQIFMGVAAFALLASLPLLGRAERWGWAFAVCIVAALGFAVTAGLQPAFSATSPQRLNLRYVEQDGKAWWMADAVPKPLRDAMAFSAQPERHFVRGYAASAGKATHPAPSAVISRVGDAVTLQIKSSGDGVVVKVLQAAGLTSVNFDGVEVAAPQHQDVFVSCVTPDCDSARITLALSSPHATTLTLVARRNGLPPGGEKLLRARSPEAVPSQEGDVTLITTEVRVPAR